MELLLLLPPWAPFSFLGVVLATLLLLRTVTRRRRRGASSSYNLPPGPRPWPVIGNLDLVGGALPHRSAHELSRRHGPLMQLWLGSLPVVVASSVDTARFFLETHDDVDDAAPTAAAGDGERAAYSYRDIAAWSPYGAYWRQPRETRLAAELLGAAERLASSYERVRREEVGELLWGLHAASGAAVTLRGYLSTTSLNAITRMVIGKRYLDVDVEEEVAACGGGGGGGSGGTAVTTPEELRWMLDELSLLNGVLNVGAALRWSDWMDLQGYVSRMKKLGKMFDRFLEHVVKEHRRRRRREGRSFVAEDMVDVLLHIADDPNLGVKLDRESIKALTQDLIVSGTESSAVTIEWALSELLKRPEAIAKATEELDHVIGRDRWVMEKDIPRLPYIDAIVKETMRMHPVAPLLVSRLSHEDTSVGIYDIQKGTRVLINTWSIGRDPALWDVPEEFQPERFLRSKLDVKGQGHEMLSFGLGPQMCPGYTLGLKVIQMSLANLLHGFAWRLPHSMSKEELSMEEIFGLSTPRKFPLEVVVEPKLPTHLYAVS
ncbi:hypothetical protein ACP4OV_025491 [Aristida adscensionis]